MFYHELIDIISCMLIVLIHTATKKVFFEFYSAANLQFFLRLLLSQFSGFCSISLRTSTEIPRTEDKNNVKNKSQTEVTKATIVVL